MTPVKICGLARREDVEAAVAFGASYVGFVLWARSPRAATLDMVRAIAPALPAAVTPVGVFVNPTADDINAAADAGIRLAQVHGAGAMTFEQARVPIIRAVHLAPAGDELDPNVPDEVILLDAHDPVKVGGTGRTIDWARAARIAKHRRVILAGGLTPDNVAQAISDVRPFAVDVASGVEAAPGIKDHDKMRAFINAARLAPPAFEAHR